ncbi:tubulin-like doman-containing protein [uncultured Tateyamaria sp.]|uniref:tubulin-like doman-containing protein n=1 Tax=uncultured Tateyamaria sp. TaxID=455651 RepID=UPI00260AA842|nr:tubulin-like doman-containing protein [uncultured Tateyamaria sp.]
MATDNNFRPTLLVGVGGTGSIIAEQIMEQALAADASLGNWIRILVLDTDANDLGKLKNLTDRSQYQFSKPETVYRILERNPSIETDWCYSRNDPEMSQVVLGKSLIEGAGQIRILTRMALHDSFVNDNLLSRMEDILGSLTTHDDDQRFGGAVHVLMLGSLAGATGSGSFTQVALALKQAARNRSVHATVRGVFLLPDVYARSGALPRTQVPNVLANGYAALKELNAINVRAQLPQRKANFSFEYLPGHDLKDGNSPFEAVTLLDYENSEGGSMGRNLNAYLRMAARSGYLLVFSPLGASYGSVTINDVRQQIGAVANGSTNLYSGIGVSAVNYPRDSMRRFLGRKLVIENLKGDWMRLDNAYRSQVARFKREQAAGQTAAEEPKQSESFIRGLSQLAQEEPRIPFFRENYDYLFPEVEDEMTRERKIKPRHIAYLDALTDYISRQFWSEGDTAQVKSRASMDESALLESDSLVDTVRRQEADLDSDFRVVDAALQKRPEDYFINTQITADGVGPGEWAAHHVQSYIVENAPHPVGVRAFLYLVQKEIAERRAKLDPRAQRLKLFRIANMFREEEEISATNNRPTSRGAPRVSDHATKADEGGSVLNKLTGRKRKAFAQDYVEYFNASLTSMRNYVDISIEAKMLDQADAEIAALIRVFEGLFTEIQDIILSLENDVEKELKPYDPSTGFSGDAYVYANRACKEDAWQKLSQNAMGLKLDDGVNMQLVRSVYDKHRSDRVDRKQSDFSQINALFRREIVEGFGQKTVDTDFRSAFEMTVIDAIRAQCAVEDAEAIRLAEERNEDPPRPASVEDRLKAIVDRAAKQSQPYLALSRPDSDGTPIKFWTLHPACEDALNDEALFSEMFNSQDGDRPIVEPNFSRYELICVNLRVNVELPHLSKLAMADSANASSVHAQTEGRLSQAYQELVDRMLDPKRSSGAGAEITPHLDKSWHMPGALPEIHRELEGKMQVDVARGYAIARLHDLIKLYRDGGVPVAQFSTVGFGLPNSFDEELAQSHDPWTVYQSFAANMPYVGGAVAFWEKVKSGSNSGLQAHPSFKSLTDPEGLMHLAMPATVRNDTADDRDAAVRDSFKAWIGLISELVDAQETGMTNRGRRIAKQECVDKARQDLMAFLREEEFEPVHIQIVERLIAQAYDDVFAQ